MSTEITLHAWDWLVIGLYLAMTIGIAWYVRHGQKTAADFFLAGRNMPWIVVAISMYATLFSTISFVAVPGEAYKHGVMLSINTLGYAIFTPLGMWLFLRFFYQVETFTAYEYLQRRFNATTRTLGSFVFLISRSLYAGTVFYAAAKIFESLVGWDATTTILIVGAFAIVYTTIGGLRAVMITDVVQTAILLSGLLVVLWKVSAMIDYDFAGAWTYAREHQRTFQQAGEPEFFSFSPYVRYTIWIWLVMSLIRPLSDYGTDQLVVQRLLSSKSYNQAKRAIWAKTFATVPIMAAFYGVGILMFFYYRTQGDTPDGFQSDHVMGLFINQHLPSPIPGLIAAALIAALMSTVDSTVNSLSTVTCKDILERARLLGGSQTTQLRVGRWLTLVWGVVVLGLALLLTWAGQGVESTVMEVAGIWGALWGVLLMVMLAGVVTRWATARAATAALIVGMIINLTLPWYLYYGTAPENRISFAWVGMPGIIVAALIVFGGSLLDPRKADTTNLVLADVAYRDSTSK